MTVVRGAASLQTHRTLLKAKKNQALRLIANLRPLVPRTNLLAQQTNLLAPTPQRPPRISERLKVNLGSLAR